MENATKALIMAASVLIALMILGALLLMLNNLSSYQETNVQSTRETQILKFNEQYETYNREDVRGSDLYSLLNRVIDYNRRKTVKGTGLSDEGEYLAYQEMTIEFKMKDEHYEQLSQDGNHNLIKEKTYIINENSNKFENSIKNKVDEIETSFGSDVAANLAANITKIFPTNPTTNQQKEAIMKFKNICKKNTIVINGTTYNVNNITWNDLKDGSSIRKDIYTYYEYVQFKRAYFNCKKTEYNNNTGRIIKMEFESNGKFN